MSFLEIRFPTEISYGASGGAEFSTDVTVLGSGFEQRNARWAAPRAQWNVATAIKNSAELDQVFDFFRVVKGRLKGFRWKDWMDFKSTEDMLAVISATDQDIGTGDNTTTQFQVRKNYTFGAETVARDIKKLVTATTTIAVAGNIVTNWSVDTNTGLMSFSIRHSKTGSDLAMVNISGSTWEIQSTSTDLSGFRVGEGIEVSGFANGVNNTDPGEVFILTQVSATSLRFTSGDPTAESPGLSVTVNTNAAPLTGQAVTAGFEFDVPARFETDLMQAEAQGFDTHVWSQIIVVEIRL